MNTNVLNNATPLRRINDDIRLRPFLSHAFDNQAYIKNVMKDGKSEECFHTIVQCIDEINVEIKGYISQHKDDLMSGMQDVATLADKYSKLSTSSQKLHRNIDSLKKEMQDSYSLVNTKTLALEQIHSTSILLYQIKQFLHAKKLLDHYINNSEEKDLRNLSNAAKLISELENLLTNPKLLEIQMISKSITSIKLFGQSLRLLAQDRLIEAIKDKNQAAIANSLQVFYNLDSLPEITLMVIDNMVKVILEATQTALDMENISTLLNDNQSSSTTNKSITSHAANLMTTTPSKQFNTSNSSSNLTTSNHSNTTTATATQVVQVKNAIREIGHVWSTALHEHAMKIHVLQRVMMKKEDPTTHIKFIHVLKQYSSTNMISSNNTSPKGNIISDHRNATTISTQLLTSGKLLDLFWYRLSVSLSDIAADKVKHYTIASCHSYPFLRKAAVNTVTTLEHWIEIDAQRDNAGNIFHTNTIENNSFQLYSSSIANINNNVLASSSSTSIPSIASTTDSEISLYGNAVSSHGMFGSLNWNQTNLLDYQQHSLVGSANKFHMKQQHNPNYQLKIMTTTIPTKSTHSLKNNHQNILSSVNMQSNNPIIDISELEDDLSPSSTTTVLEEHYLVQGLKPFRDRYLIISLSKMTAPIMQMFPELEGFTAAVPSKRDLQALIKSIEIEFVTALVEGDSGLVTLVCREFKKAVKLMLTKIEGMILHSQDTKMLATQNNFARSQGQQHNAQLYTLLIQLLRALDSIPNNVCEQAITDSRSVFSDPPTIGSTTNTAVSGSTTSGSGVGLVVRGSFADSNVNKKCIFSVALTDMQSAIQTTTEWIQNLAQKHILSSVVISVSSYVNSILINLTKEGVVSAKSIQIKPSTTSTQYTGKVPVVNNNNNNNPSSSSQQESAAVECSQAVQILVKNIPHILKTHVLSLPSSEGVNTVLEEIYLRIIHTYITISALLRPVTETSRLRTAKDLSSLESMLSSLYTIPDPINCPVIKESKAYRRLLFQDNVISDGVGGNIIKSKNILTLSYISQLRPSTLLGYLISCAPTSLPSPYDLAGLTLITYIEKLNLTDSKYSNTTNYTSNSSISLMNKKKISKYIDCIRNLYITDDLLHPGLTHNHLIKWSSIDNEIKAWELIQQSLDIFFQRIHVSPQDPEHKNNMRLWYEAILDIGSQLL